MRLGPDTLGRLGDDCPVPSYDRDNQETGIVHFGLGAFARAHLAAFTDRAMRAGERDWMIAGVSLRSAGVGDQLNPQAGLYSLSRQGPDGFDTRVIGSVREVMLASRDDDRIVSAIASPKCHIVSFTVTEKGYCRAAGGGIDHAAARNGFYPLLAAGLAQRKERGLPGLTLLSCDNLPENGEVLGHLVAQWLEKEAPDLASWFVANCRTPNTMVDRIVPATTEEDLSRLADRIGLRDEGAVFTEPFSQWVIEDDFAGPRPNWEDHGAQIVRDVAPFEVAKLRMLNGAHSLLAYVGLARGHSFVHEAIADPWLGPLVDRLMLKEAAPTVPAAAGQDLATYSRDLLHRFANPALEHRLAQIAMDGSQKIPQRWLATLADATVPCTAILTGIAAWLLHIEEGEHLDDPLATELQNVIRAGRDTSDWMASIFGTDGLLPSGWKPSPDEIALVEKSLSGLRE